MPRSHPDRSERTVHRTRALVACALAVAGLLVATACAPAAAPAFGPPTFRLVADGSGLVRFDPPGIGAGGAVFALQLDVHNPNPVPVRLSALDGELFLAGARVAASQFPEGIDLPARGGTRLTLEVAVPAERVLDLAGAIVDIVAGRSVSYRLDGSVGVDVLGVPQRFPTVTLAQGQIQQDLRLRAPAVALDGGASGVREVAFDRVVIDLAFTVRNPNRLGVEVRAPDARLRIGDREVATIALPPQRIPALGEASVVQRVVVNPLQLGPAIVTQLQQLVAGGAASLEVAVTGRWELDVPGITSLRLEPGDLLRGRLD